ncbi:pathogen-related protein isoform X1 [Prosopis cineraria]|uniref:pathogen-related protein isoform X1 n=1 Tax=Prosopis cineraria TaxID=364024 RepID=UPI0024108F10|nr:pathogen-related protein isoform X1 [Prosopis cineraria]
MKPTLSGDMVALPATTMSTCFSNKAEPWLLLPSHLSLSLSRFLHLNHFFICFDLQEWPEGSLEETVQNAVKTWEMELSHKTRLQDFKSINPHKFKLFVNGREGLSGEETLRMGSYNALLQNSLPEPFRYYKAEEETFESSHEAFRSAFPRGFAWEVIKVYTGPPEITFKFRHWGFFEGPFKGHPPTGKMVQFYGLATLKVDESLRAEEVEVYYDPAELIGGLLSRTHTTVPINETSKSSATSQGCPFSK